MISKGESLFGNETKDKNEYLRKSCVRFAKDGVAERDISDAVAYISLRKYGCPRKEAIQFAAKSNCRVDTTKFKDGPR